MPSGPASSTGTQSAVTTTERRAPRGARPGHRPRRTARARRRARATNGPGGSQAGRATPGGSRPGGQRRRAVGAPRPRRGPRPAVRLRQAAGAGERVRRGVELGPAGFTRRFWPGPRRPCDRVRDHASSRVGAGHRTRGPRPAGDRDQDVLPLPEPLRRRAEHAWSARSAWAIPGTLPVLNRARGRPRGPLALALGCRVARVSVFARKNYFYPDLPKGYQISQYDRPLADGGDAAARRGRSPGAHPPPPPRGGRRQAPARGPGRRALRTAPSLVDFNRCGVPLVEIVSRARPRTRRPRPRTTCSTLHQVLLYTGTSDGNMEEGSLRCDANVSVRPVGETRLGTKTEIKNLNSFRNVARAIEPRSSARSSCSRPAARSCRRRAASTPSAAAPGRCAARRRRTTTATSPSPTCRRSRSPPSGSPRCARELPELPWERRARFVAALGLPAADARDARRRRRALADYFERAARRAPRLGARARQLGAQRGAARGAGAPLRTRRRARALRRGSPRWSAWSRTASSRRAPPRRCSSRSGRAARSPPRPSSASASAQVSDEGAARRAGSPR